MIDPTADALARVQADAQGTDDGPIRMINLLRFRDVADYGDRPDPAGESAPSTGAEAYRRYAAVAIAEVEAVGGSQFYYATVHQTVIGDEEWDTVAIVEYPSRAAFLEMISKPSYQAGVYHRTAGLADTRLIMTTGF